MSKSLDKLASNSHVSMVFASADHRRVFAELKSGCTFHGMTFVSAPNVRVLKQRLNEVS